MGDNLDHLQDNMRLMAHINSSQARMANLEQKLIELGELFLAAMRQSLSEARTLDAGGDDRDDQPPIIDPDLATRDGWLLNVPRR